MRTPNSRTPLKIPASPAMRLGAAMLKCGLILGVVLTADGAGANQPTDPNVLELAIAQAKPGQTVNLPAGTFTITEPIKPGSGLRLIGAGQDKTVVRFASNQPGAMMSLADCEDVEVARLMLDAQNNTNVRQGISGSNSRRLNLHHLTIRNLSKGSAFGPLGILFAGVNPTRERGVADSEISDCLIENIAPDASFGCGIRFSWGSIQSAAQFQGEKSGIAFHYFYRCKFDRTSPTRGKPIYPHDAGHGFRTNGDVRNCVFEGCEFADNDGYGIQFGGTGLDAFTFVACAIRKNKGPAMVGLADYHALEWDHCTVEGNAVNDLRSPKPFGRPAPVAAFHAPAKSRAGEPIRFTNESRAAEGQIAAWLWDFNDGAPSSERNPIHAFTQPGEFRVTLIVWDDHGRGARMERHLIVGP